jgi:uncharacterized protein (TIGR02594 family)
MATKKVPGQSGPWIKSDEIVFDTTNAPWMSYAKAELGKKVHELAANDAFISEMRSALIFDSQMRTIEKQMGTLSTGSLFLESNVGPEDAGRYKLFSKNLGDAARQALRRIEAARLKERNPEIMNYLEGVKNDPAYDDKGKSVEIPKTYESAGYRKITAWCAAFVNWCLSQADAPHLGYATAKSWLEFGTPVAHPVYGCLTITKPSSSTGSTTGHVAFFVEHHGNKVVLFGGNQHHGLVSETPFGESMVVGYRWPTKINYYLLSSRGVLT